MTPSHHIARTRLYLNFAVRNTAEGDLDRAAKALARAVSHTATAAGNHWDMLVNARRTRRRLQIALNIMADRGQITRSLAGVMREAYALPKRMTEAMTAAPDAQSGRRNVIRLLRRTRTRARRLLRRLETAMTADPNPPTWEEILAQAEARAEAREAAEARAAAEAKAAANPAGPASSCICHGENIPGFPPCPGPAPYARPHPSSLAPR